MIINNNRSTKTRR